MYLKTAFSSLLPMVRKTFKAKKKNVFGKKDHVFNKYHIFMEFSKILFHTLNTQLFRYLIIFSLTCIITENNRHKQTKYPTRCDFEVKALVSSCSFCRIWVGENSCQSYHVYKVIKMLCICDKVLRLTLLGNHTQDFTILMPSKF